MDFETVRQWQGTAAELTQELERQIKGQGLSLDTPTLRTVRLWRSKGLLSQPKGQKFGFRQILEGLATALLAKKGWTLVAIAQVLPSFSDSHLENEITAEAKGSDPTWSLQKESGFLREHRQDLDLAEDAVILLAQGILRQYRQILSEQIIRQDDTMPHELHKAMCKLGRLYIEEGMLDKAACIHNVLATACHPLNSPQWGLKIFQQSDFRFCEALLIDPNLRVPTSDCSEIASLSSSFGEDNVIQYRLHKQLREATEKLGTRRQHQAYTALRGFLFGKRSLIKERQLLDYLFENELTPIQGMVVNTFFDSVPDSWLIHGLAHRCAYCGTLMRPHPNTERFPDGCCPIRQCRGQYQPKVTERLDPEEDRLLIAKPQILMYWTGPAIDELAIFEAAEQKGLTAELYPESDLCDVSINDRNIGIDAKSYSSPVTLALHLNRSIGGLIHYHRRIIAISDSLIENNPSYLTTLRSTLAKTSHLATLELLSVSQVIQLLGEI